MKVEQFFDQGLAHLSYAILSEGEIALIDPARDSTPYFEFAKKNNAEIKVVIETHPHADFISSHAELARKGIDVYISKLAGALYPFIPFDEGDKIQLGELTLKALSTPGHSPDSISVILLDPTGKEYAVFTGDTLFIGDVGRPDLRETGDGITAKKELLATQMYHSLRDKLMKLPDYTIVFPAHGAGSLCGKSMSQELSGTIGQQKKENYALQDMDVNQFVKTLLNDQPSIPKYFPYDVSLNRKGANDLGDNLGKIKIVVSENEIARPSLIIDTRNEKEFKSGHLKGAINIQNGAKFETWLGSIIAPEEKFYLVSSKEHELNEVILKAAKIGYEVNIQAGLFQSYFREVKEEELPLDHFLNHQSAFNIVDVRDKSELEEVKYFEHAIHIPLSVLRERIKEIPLNKPAVVHCAGGYRSAIASSLLSAVLQNKVYDLGENIKKIAPIQSN